MHLIHFHKSTILTDTQYHDYITNGHEIQAAATLPLQQVDTVLDMLNDFTYRWCIISILLLGNNYQIFDQNNDFDVSRMNIFGKIVQKCTLLH